MDRMRRKLELAYFSLPLLLLLLLVQQHQQTSVVVSAANMNGAPGQYKIANSDTYVTDYSDDIEYFDVYSEPIKTLYGQVHWRAHPNVKLPEHLIERFENKVMAIVGYEVDQVRQEKGTGKEIPVPITWAYNHHYGAFLLNARTARLVQKKVTPETARLGLNHGRPTHWAAEFRQQQQKETNESSTTQHDFDFPQVHFFSEGNGGEMRVSYHGYPSRYAQLIDSPDTFQVFPMQIDTWNRDTSNATYLPGGPLPSSSRIPTDNTAGYSGLIECPCSDRLVKTWGMAYTLLSSNNATSEKARGCSMPVQNATECFHAARTVVAASRYINRVLSNDATLPSGCSIRAHRNGSTLVVWNKNKNNKTENIDQKRAVVTSNSKNDMVAFAAGQVNLTVEQVPHEVKMTLVGPADVWFAVGFGTDSMCLKRQADECPSGGPYAISVQDDTVMERKLAYHGPGTILNSTVMVQSNTVSKDGSSRTVVLTRSLQGATALYYTFDPQTTMVPVIMAKGCSLEFAQHCGHGPSYLNFLQVGQPTQVCQAGVQGSIDGDAFGVDRCAPFPTSDLLNQRNPTCWVQSYVGGLSCCRDGKSLLDKEQEQPWPDAYLEYRLKFRFYFEEYQHTPMPSHESLVRLYWQTESFAGEYDISPCPEGTPSAQCIQVITSRWTVRDMMRDCVPKDASWCTGKGSTDSNKTAGVQFIYAAPHCHAPTCLSMELYNADTGQLLCHVEPIHGKNSSSPYEEEQFLSIPPCLWGGEEQGLISPQLLSLDTTLLSIKRNNNTLPHTGEMASWQMRGVVVPRPSATSSRRFDHPKVDGKDDTSTATQLRRAVDEHPRRR